MGFSVKSGLLGFSRRKKFITLLLSLNTKEKSRESKGTQTED